MSVRATLVGLAALTALFAPLAAHAQSSPSDYTYATRYDAARRVVGTIAPDPDGTGSLHYLAVRNTYDAAGRLVKIEKGELATWQSETVAPSAWTGFTIAQIMDDDFDAMDHKIRERVSGAGTVQTVTEYSYDEAGRALCTAVRMNPAAFLTPLTDTCVPGPTGSAGPDRIEKIIYSVNGDIAQVRRAVGTPLEQAYASYTYTANGKQATMADADGNVASMTYDGLDRQTQWNFPDKVSVGTVSSTDYEAYTYDANANRTSLRKRDGRVLGYTYDNLNRVIVKSVPGACVSGYACTTPPSSAVRNVYYGYDLRGLQTYARFDSSSGSDTVDNAYDGFGRLTSQTSAMYGVSRTVSYLYDADGNKVRITHPDGVYFTTDYDGLDRAITVKENGTTAIAAMAYDARGQQTGETRDTVATTFGYDGVGRLSSLSDDLPGGSANDITTTLAYNPASQIVGRTRSNPTLYAWTGYTNVSRTYTANGLNQYAAVAGTTFSYDANGNLVSDGTTSYTYDAENRLVATTFGPGATLVYDPLGRLYGFAGSAAKSSVYDGDQRIVDYSADPAVVATRYVMGPGNDNPLVWYAGSALTDRRSLQADERGSIVSVVDSTGALLGINSYDEYGIPAATNIGRYGYTGQIWITPLGMWYYKARFYSPTLGRFMQTDPIGYADQNNLYAYVANDPINKTDPTGEDAGSFYSSGLGIVYPQPGDERQVIIAMGGYAAILTGSIFAVEALPIIGVPVAKTLAPQAARNAERAVPTLSRATQVAMRGGPNSTLVRQFAERSTTSLNRTIRSLTARIEEHAAKIRNPAANMTREDASNPGAVKRAINDWQKEIRNYSDQRDIARDILRNR